MGEIAEYYRDHDLDFDLNKEFKRKSAYDDANLIMKVARNDIEWTKKDDEKIKLINMSIAHINNAKNMLQKKNILDVWQYIFDLELMLRNKLKQL